MFELGHIVATPAALDLLNQHQVSTLDLLRRHVSGDFGDLCSDDIETNLHAIKTGLRILSKYKIDEINAVYIITESDRSSTCVLLPQEY